jgi:hypothetical protein
VKKRIDGVPITSGLPLRYFVPSINTFKRFDPIEFEIVGKTPDIILMIHESQIDGFVLRENLGIYDTLTVNEKGKFAGIGINDRPVPGIAVFWK